MYHTTKDGRKIKLKDMSLTHLRNTIAMLERIAKEGITVGYGGGGVSSAEDMWYEEEDLYGTDALKYLNYDKYVKELKRRNA